MSATADIARYREYFKDLGTDDRVEVLAIPNSPQHKIYERRVSYLEQVSFCNKPLLIHKVHLADVFIHIFSIIDSTFFLPRKLY